VNVIGLFATTQALLPHFRRQKEGVIVNISSVGGKITFPLGALYHGTKFAVEGLSEALSYEMSAIGVRVKLVEPGMIKTDFAGRSFEFNNEPAITEYQPVVQAVFAALGPMAEMASRKVSMPTRSPWSITTSEPMSISAMTARASDRGLSGLVVYSVLPLTRRMSLTFMGSLLHRQAGGISRRPTGALHDAVPLEQPLRQAV
jgi:short-subunit dehydrogenase